MKHGQEKYNSFSGRSCKTSSVPDSLLFCKFLATRKRLDGLTDNKDTNHLIKKRNSQGGHSRQILNGWRQFPTQIIIR